MFVVDKDGFKVVVEPIAVVVEVDGGKGHVSRLSAIETNGRSAQLSVLSAHLPLPNTFSSKHQRHVDGDVS